MSLQNLKVQSYILFEPQGKKPIINSVYTVTLQVRSQRDNSELWAIYCGQNVLDKTIKEFVYEPPPSSRDAQFIKDCRFESAQAAYDFWNQHLKDSYIKKMAEMGM